MLVSTEANADMTIRGYLDIQKTEEGKDRLDFFINGLGTGMGFSQVALEARGQPRLYCTPKRLSLTSENYKNILDEQIKITGDKVSPDHLVSLYLLLGLSRTFPCK